MNWCAAFQSAAMQACLLPGEEPPHDYRAGVVELVEDTSPGKDGKAPFSGRYVPVEKTRSGEFTPCVGDLAIWDRSDSSKPDTIWWRHVNRVVLFNSTENTFQTVGGNEAQRVAVGEHPLSSSKLLGWIHYPAPESLGASVATFTESERERILNNVGMFLRETADTIWRSYKP
jgi:hypothetical protein